MTIFKNTFVTLLLFIINTSEAMVAQTEISGAQPSDYKTIVGKAGFFQPKVTEEGIFGILDLVSKATSASVFGLQEKSGSQVIEIYKDVFLSLSDDINALYNLLMNKHTASPVVKKVRYPSPSQTATFETVCAIDVQEYGKSDKYYFVINRIPLSRKNTNINIGNVYFYSPYVFTGYQIQNDKLYVYTEYTGTAWNTTYITISIDPALKTALTGLISNYTAPGAAVVTDTTTTEYTNFVTYTHKEHGNEYRLIFVFDGTRIQVTPVYIKEITPAPSS